MISIFLTKFPAKSFIAAVIVLCLGFNAASAEPTKYAVLIAVQDYMYADPDGDQLVFTKSDASALRNELFRIGFEKENIFVLTCGTVSKNLVIKQNIEFVINDGRGCIFRDSD